VIAYPLPAQSREDLLAALRLIGADPRSNAYFEPKRDLLSLFIPKADFRAAAFLKQELLARGGDAVVNRGVISCEASESAVLLLGTPGQLRSLTEKLGALPCWGLPGIREGLSRALAGMDRSAWTFSFREGRVLSLGKRTAVMGILNLTSDSFYAKSRIPPEDDLLSRARSMVAAGAAVLDLGAESTRPGSDPVPEAEETGRLLPAVAAVRKAFPETVISADTWKAKVALEAVRAGADIINDISGLGFDPDLPGAVAESGAALVLSHIQGTPRDMQKDPKYEDTVGDILRYFEERLSLAEKAGIPAERIILDPGLGFGKRREDNLRILRNLDAFRVFGRPLLIGHSRKGFIGATLGLDAPEDRLEGTLAVTALCGLHHAALVRVHDVEENVRVLSMLGAIGECRE
jgi:dihydropteroate synthase